MSTLPPDPYKILGVSKVAQIPEIRSAHRKLVLKCHPDKVQDPTLKAQKQDEFQNVQQAYELLSDEKERQRYDDQVRLHELRDQLRAKTSSSSARSSPSHKYETRSSDRPASYKTSTTPTTSKSYYSRSWEDDTERAPRNIFEEVRIKKEPSYSEKSSKRSKDKDRDYARDRSREYREYRESREREDERERARRKAEKAEEAMRRAEKEAKEARKAEKKAREKERDKEKKRETEEKKRHAKPSAYMDSYDEEPVYKEKKKSSKKHEERRERSSHREEVPPTTSSMPPPPMPQPYSSMERTLDTATSYIQASRTKPTPLHRAATFHARHVQPPAPTPPPVSGQASAFASPDEDVRRSSTRPRRGSSGDKAYKKPSKEVLDDPIVADASPSSRLHKSTSASAAMAGSPPRREIPRTNTMPVEGYARPIPNISRAQTFSGAFPEITDPRGRSRSKMQSQVLEDYDSDEEYERRRERDRERKHRSKKHRSPEREHVMQYKVSEGRTTLQNSYSRGTQMESYAYYPSSPHGVHVVENRPLMPSREGSYSRSGSYSAKYPKFKTSKDYDYSDVSYSAYPVENVY